MNFKLIIILKPIFSPLKRQPKIMALMTIPFYGSFVPYNEVERNGHKYENNGDRLW